MSPQFTIELDRICDYLSYSLNSPKTAKKFYFKVKNSIIFHLTLFPEQYSKVSISNKFQNRNLRKIPINNYIIIYEVDNYNHKVHILHIFHGSQNYQNRLYSL